jgi:proline racemase
MTCNLLVPPVSPEADVGFICFEQGGFTPMSGSNTICVVTALLEVGMLPRQEGVNRVVLDTPAGLVPTRATVKDGRVVEVEFDNVPSFVARRGMTLDVDGVGSISVDVAYGGQFYVLVSARALGVRLDVSTSRELARLGAAVLAAAQAAIPVQHPEIPEIDEITWALIYDEAIVGGVSRSCVVGPTGVDSPGRPDAAVGVIDRSPCGTGTSARMALLHARGELGNVPVFKHENILGLSFTGRVIGPAAVGGIPAIRTAIAGRAYITGFSKFLVDDEDPFPMGYVLGDIWAVP